MTVLTATLILAATDAMSPIQASDQPRVVATVPAQGAAIPSGPFLLSVTFDRSMAPGSFSFVQVSPASFPGCAPTPALARDRRTYTLRCRARPGGAYEVWFNRPPFMNFRSDDGSAAVPYRLCFRAKG